MIEQVAIGLCGVSSIWLSQSLDGTVRRWAPIFGLCAQPFWFYSTYRAEQWGIFFLCFLYTAAWARGWYYQWWKV
jgi:hypothetical protein